jgi:CRISPR system Cascade subunit CasA
MNLLTDQWIPVRPLEGSKAGKITLRNLLCGKEKWEVCLPRDDMELAAIQLLICITQTLITPKTARELRSYIAKPLSEVDYETAIHPYGDWFQLDHPKFPFMQVRGVIAKIITPMDKLLAGLTGAENCCFVNEPGLATRLCGGCTAIALFNQASCSPSFGGGNEGGFKPGLRGSSPITTLVQGQHLRQTVWLNVLYQGQLDQNISWHNSAKYQKPTWIDPIKRGANIHVQQIGIIRGLLWQPAHVELLLSKEDATCSCCGFSAHQVYRGFIKEQFGFNVIGKWPHPYSSRKMINNKGKIEERFASFKTSIPSWTQLGRFIVRRKLTVNMKEGQQPAAVIHQVRNQQMYGNSADQLHLLIGGYRTDNAKVLERCHDVYTLNHGWERNAVLINQIVHSALAYRDALYTALYDFAHGMQVKSSGNRELKLKGALRGKDKEKDKIKTYFRRADASMPRDKKSRIYFLAEAQFFRRSESTLESMLARIDFANPEIVLTNMRRYLRRISENIFDETVNTYRHDPEVIRTIAFTRIMLRKKLNDLEPQQGKGGNNGATETP